MNIKGGNKKGIFGSIVAVVGITSFMGVVTLLVPIVVIVLLFFIILDPLGKSTFGESGYNNALSIVGGKLGDNLIGNDGSLIKTSKEDEIRLKLLGIYGYDTFDEKYSIVPFWMNDALLFLKQIKGVDPLVVSLIIDGAGTYKPYTDSKVITDITKLSIDKDDFMLNKNTKFIIQFSDGQYDDYLRAMQDLYKNEKFLLIYENGANGLTFEKYKRFGEWYTEYSNYIKDYNSKYEDKKLDGDQNNKEIEDKTNIQAPKTDVVLDRKTEIEFIKEKLKSYNNSYSENDLNNEFNIYITGKNHYGYIDYKKIYNDSKMVYEKFGKKRWDLLNDSERKELGSILMGTGSKNRDILIVSALYYFVKDKKIDTQEKLVNELNKDGSDINKLLNTPNTPDKENILNYIYGKNNKNGGNTAIITTTGPVNSGDLIGYQSNMGCVVGNPIKPGISKGGVQYSGSGYGCHIHLEVEVYKDGVKLNKTGVPRVESTLRGEITEGYGSPGPLFDYGSGLPRMISQDEWGETSHNKPGHSAIDVILNKDGDTCGVPIYSPADGFVEYKWLNNVKSWCSSKAKTDSQLSIQVTWTKGNYTYKATFDHVVTPQQYYEVMGKY